MKHALPGQGGPAEGDEDRGSQRIPDHGGHLHPPGSGNDAGHGGGHGGRVQGGEHFGQEGPVAETQEQDYLVPRDRDLRLISRSFGSGVLSFRRP